MTENNRTSPPLSSVRKIGKSVLEIAKSRIELIGIELTQEKERLLEIALLSLSAMLFGFLGLVVLTALIMVLFWETWRWQAMIVILVVYLLLALFCAAFARKILRDAPLPFEGTIAEFEKDYITLHSD
ncbi:phage holin family protein [Candidatus Pandoraea novymonadis]|uniref:Inner membrane protein YqjE n=1 Tax=Candidatus Pandoraea novymonadis TaxID=1808959 RepID=A0ABX5FDG9_9BURK|nr:phage holin family protein [Candidatus Pandoraea novymonadis]PSB91803.1 hypothetical protein BZL35_00016 [Candidatus Pandoraea novymonadis]